jgi:hypothetical protein
MNESFVFFIAGLLFGGCIISFIFMRKTHRATKDKVEHFEAKNEILLGEISKLTTDIAALKQLEIENAKLKYQSEAASTVARTIVDSGLQREQELTLQLEEERAGRYRAERLLQEEIIKFSSTALEVEADLKLIKETLAQSSKHSLFYKGTLVPMDKASDLETDILPRLEAQVYKLRSKA